MAADNTVRVDPEALQRAARAANDGAEDLRSRLAALHCEVATLLGGWHGAAGSAYAAVWEPWHRGAGELQESLAILARSLAEAGLAYQCNETRSAEALRVVVGRVVGQVVGQVVDRVVGGV
ncbi:MAG: WXG100 family type VII secretion target [Mycobacterium sp.]